MENKIIYIVLGSFSSWDDYHTRIFKAFYKKEDAEKYVEKANRILKAMANHIAEASKKTSMDFDSFDEYEEFENTDEFKKALAIWSAHSSLQEFNECKIEEVSII